MGMQLSERRTNRWLEKSSRALARRRRSASASATVPHLTIWRRIKEWFKGNYKNLSYVKLEVN